MRKLLFFDKKNSVKCFTTNAEWLQENCDYILLHQNNENVNEKIKAGYWYKWTTKKGNYATEIRIRITK